MTFRGRRGGLIAGWLVAGGLLACSSNPLGPGGECNTANAIEICIDRSEYRPGGTVAYALTNLGSANVNVDTCSLTMRARTRPQAVPVMFDPSRRCGVSVTSTEITAQMSPLIAGETFFATIQVGQGSPQGFYRVFWWLLDDAGGALVSEQPISSSEFSVFPSAN